VHPSTRRIWFQDLLPDHVADEQLGINARIWTFGYNAGLASSARASIYDYSRQLLNRVNGVRDGHEHHKIIWICHSLGGLVVKWVRVLRISSCDTDTTEMELKTVPGPNRSAN
jgi:hypothetical protein